MGWERAAWGESGRDIGKTGTGVGGSRRNRGFACTEVGAATWVEGIARVAGRGQMLECKYKGIISKRGHQHSGGQRAQE